MGDLPSMPLFIDDFEADTAHLTLEEDGVYNRLLRLCWRQSSCSIPDDPVWITRHMRVDEATFERVVAPILKEFFKRRKGRLYSPRQAREFKWVKNKSHRRREAGKKGGRAKARKNNEKATSKPTDLPQANGKQNGGDAVAPIPIPIPIPIEESKYAFAGKVIRLNRDDYDTWKATYHAVPDLNAELRSLDDYYASEPPDKRKRWFVRASAALRKKHEAHLARQKEAGGELAYTDGTTEEDWRGRRDIWEQHERWHSRWGPRPTDDAFLGWARLTGEGDPDDGE